MSLLHVAARHMFLELQSEAALGPLPARAASEPDMERRDLPGGDLDAEQCTGREEAPEGGSTEAGSVEAGSVTSSAVSSPGSMTPVACAPAVDLTELHARLQASAPACAWMVPGPYHTEHLMTTLMLRNIPNDLTREGILELFARQGFLECVDFLYAPMDFRYHAGFGYGFVNLRTPADAAAFVANFDGFTAWGIPSRKQAEVSWSQPLQGLKALLNKYKNSSIMHADVPDKFKPIALRNGRRVLFAQATRQLSPPAELALMQKCVCPTVAATVDQPACAEHADVPPTTVMLKNLPGTYSRSWLVQLLDREGFAGCYDFLYLPMDFAQAACMGYAVVNLTSHELALRFKTRFTGFADWGVQCRKVGQVLWSSPLQGRAAHIERFRNHAVMHECMPDEFKPILLCNGVRVSFPAPTRPLRLPRWER